MRAGYPRPLGPNGGGEMARRRVLASAAGLAAGLLAGCGSRPITAPGGGPQGSFERPASRWVRARWEDLPGLQDDAVGQALGAWRASCARGGPAWERACAAAALLDARDHDAVRSWMLQHLEPWRIEDRSGQAEGLLTGYYEPHFEARRLPDREFRAPLHAPPADLQQRRPHWSRQQTESLREAQSALQGRTIAHLRDPLDVLILQVQGSGRLTITEPGGQRRPVRLAFAGHNDHPYQSIGRWLIEKGQITAGQASWAGIREWMRRNPSRVQEVMWVNPRVVYFREEPLPDPMVGPRGAIGIALTPERSIAVDPRSIPYGCAVWIDAVAPSGPPALRRLVVAQDTGSAITGAVRADYFWGWGERAELEAGRTQRRLRMWALMPQGGAGSLLA